MKEQLEVAKLTNGNIQWIEESASELPRETKVIAIDNEQQGIFTIGDILDTIQGQEKVEHLRKQYVIEDDVLRLHREKQLLSKLYACQDDMGELLDKGDQDIHYLMMEALINRLEIHLQNKQDLL
tara:strand:- start:459 stop:833 length:375 start_codon:yes stop_codon:yes gene_type:complete